MLETDWVNSMVDGFVHEITGMDISTLQPIDCFSLHPLYANEWITFVQKIANVVRQKAIPMEELTRVFPNPSALSIQLFFILNDGKTSRLEKKRRVELAEFFYRTLSHQRKTDPFVLHGKNIIYTETEMRDIINNVPFHAADETIARQLARVYLGGSHLAYGLYTDNYPDFGIEVNGPYDVSEKFGKNYTIIIKELLHLKPVELFPDMQSVLASKVKIFNVYENVDTKIEAASCHYSYDGDPIRGLRYWAVTADDRPVSLDELPALEKNLGEHSVKQWEHLTALSQEKLKQKMLEQRCYLFKEVCGRLGLDWKPTIEMRKAVENKPLVPDQYKVPENKDNEKKYWQKILDPRIDFYP